MLFELWNIHRVWNFELWNIKVRTLFELWSMEYRGWNSSLTAQFTPSLASLFLKADRRAQKIGFTEKKILFAENVCSKLSEVHISFRGHRLLLPSRIVFPVANLKITNMIRYLVLLNRGQVEEHRVWIFNSILPLRLRGAVPRVGISFHLFTTISTITL